MKLSFYGADQCVTGSCHCLEVGGKRILIDCGLQQGRDEIDNASLPFHPGQIDYVLVTHAHIDHSGRIPLLIKQGFQGRIITTRLTADLLDIMLQDSAHIQESDAEYKNRKNQRAGRPMEEPLYTVEDAMRVREFMDTCEYGQQIHICDGVDAVFIDAPCSGLGTLRRHPEIRWRLTEEHLGELAALGLSLLRSAAGQVARGGQLAYATCTVTHTENNVVVKRFLESPEGADFELAPIAGKACVATRLAPGTPDAHFAVRFARKR